VDQNARAFAVQAQGDRPPDAFGRAGHEDDFAFEIEFL
jgi:hypothetical protein